MSTALYEQFFLHYFVNPQLHKFNYLQQKFKSYQNPGLDHPKKSSELGYLRNYKQICTKYLCYVPNEKSQIKLTVNVVMEIIDKVYEEYAIFFQKGGAYRMIFNSCCSQSSSMRKLKAHIQELVLLKLSEKYGEFRVQFKSLDRFVLGFFFTLNYIKTCNVDVKGFCRLLLAQSEQQGWNVQNVFSNFIIQKLGESPQCGINQEETPFYMKRTIIRVKKFQKILKILSHDDELTNLSLLTQRHHNDSNYNSSLQQYSTIKSSQLKQEQEIIVEEQSIRSVIALEILMNFLKQNRIKLTQIKIYRLLKLIGLVKEKKGVQDQQKNKNSFSNLKTWEEVLNFCFQKNSMKQLGEFQQGINSVEMQRLPFQKILLMEICKINFIISQRLFKQSQSHSFQTLQAYRQQTYDFILTYLNQLFEGKNQAIRQNYQILQKLIQIHNFGTTCVKPLVKKILKHPQMHQIYLKYFDNP